MDIRLKTRVEGVHIWLPVEEAVKFIKNPKAVQAEVTIMLRVGKINPETGEPLAPVGFGVELGRRPGSEEIDKPAKQRKYPKKQSKVKRATFEKVKCDHCEKMVATSQMNKHVKSAHPESPEDPLSDPEARSILDDFMDDDDEVEG